MEKAILMHMSQSRYDLENHVSTLKRFLLDLFLSEFLSLLFHFGVNLIKVVLKVLKNHVKLITDKEDLFEFGNVRMVEFTKGLDFP